MSYTALRVVKNVIEQLSEQLIISRFRNDFGAYDLDTGVPALRFHICISADNLGYDVNGVHHKKWANQERIYVTVIVTGNHKVFQPIGRNSRKSQKAMQQSRLKRNSKKQ